MRILHLLSNHIYTGPAEPMLALIKAQTLAGHKVTLVVDTVRRGDLATIASRQGVSLEKSLALSVKAGLVQQTKDFFSLRHIWKSEHFDIIHCHKSHEHTLALLSRSRSSKTRLVRTLNKGFIPGTLKNAMLRKTDGILAVSRSDAERLLSSGLATRKGLAILGGVVDSTLFSPGEGGSVLRSSLGIDVNTPLAGLVSRIKKGRGHMLLLEAWEIVHSELPEAHLVISGRGEWADKVSALAKDERFEGTVHVLGYQRDLVGLYRGLDVTLMLAPGNDGTCRAALQAMACGKPVIASKVGALEDIVRNGHTGVLCRAHDRQDLARKLVDLLSQKVLMERMGRVARQRAKDHYSLDRHYQVVQSLYENLMSSGIGHS